MMAPLGTELLLSKVAVLVPSGVDLLNFSSLRLHIQTSEPFPEATTDGKFELLIQVIHYVDRLNLSRGGQSWSLREVPARRDQAGDATSGPFDNKLHEGTRR